MRFAKTSHRRASGSLNRSATRRYRLSTARKNSSIPVVSRVTSWVAKSVVIALLSCPYTTSCRLLKQPDKQKRARLAPKSMKIKTICLALATLGNAAYVHGQSSEAITPIAQRAVVTLRLHGFDACPGGRLLKLLPCAVRSHGRKRGAPLKTGPTNSTVG
jgi:hypothetical protein